MDRTIFDPIDAYCERLSPGLWAEPLNAFTNLAFIVAAVLVWFRMGKGLSDLGGDLSSRTGHSCPPPLGLALILTLAAIGVGSGLFHTFANGVTAILDVGAIAVFIFLYVFAVNRHVLGWSRIAAWASLMVLAPYLAAGTSVFTALPGFQISSAYWPVAILIAGYGLILLASRPVFARGLLIGAAILALSITLRSLDLALCDRLPFGTHFLWHVLNAIMLGWMIETYTRAVSTPLADASPRG